MKRNKSLMLAALVAALAFMVTGCGPKGGVVVLENQSSYELKDAYISFGNSRVGSLAPGQWMKASIDKNALVEVYFYGNALASTDSTVKNNTEVSGLSGSWSKILTRDRWTSSGTSVNDGDSIVVTVRNR